MKRRPLLIILLAAALLAGCASRQSSAPPSTPPPTPPVVQQEDTKGSTGFSVKPAPNAMQRVTYNSTREIPGPGVYVVDLTGGQVESWQASGIPGRLYLSDDRRWVISESPDQVYWANRQSGKVYGWAPRTLQLKATGKNEFLFAKVGSSPCEFYLTDAEFQLKYTFTVDLGQAADTQVQIAPDGKTVAVNTGRWPPGSMLDPHIYLVDAATGKSQDLISAPAPTAGPVYGVELVSPPGNELLVNYIMQTVGSSGPQEQSFIRRFSWQGQQSGEFLINGRAGVPSPDGRLLSSSQNLDHLTDAVVLTDLTTGQPRFRVAGAFTLQWTADGSRLVLAGRDDNEYLVSTAGELKRVPLTGQQVFAPFLVAAPDDPNRFLYGLSVLDDSGKVLQTIQLPKADDWVIRNGAWGANGNEFVVSISPPIGKGNIGFDFPLPPGVQKPPFDSPYILTVQDPAGDCLNLRDTYSHSGRAIRCLPTGTKLAVGDLFTAPVKLNAAWWYNDEQIWLWARTEQGETGWVSLSTGSVNWSH